MTISLFICNKLIVAKPKSWICHCIILKLKRSEESDKTGCDYFMSFIVRMKSVGTIFLFYDQVYKAEFR